MPTATNPTTGERFMLSGNKWVPYSEESVVEIAAPSPQRKTATNPQTGERFFLDEKTNQWAPVVAEPKPGPLETFGRGLAHGTIGLGESVGTGTQWLGKRVGSEPIAEAGKVASEYWGKKAEKFGPPADIANKNVWDNPEILANSSFWLYNVADMVPTLAASMIPAMGAGKAIQVAGKAYAWTPQVVARLIKLGQYAAGGLAGGGLEGAQTYKAVLEKGGTEEEAARSGEAMALGAGVLNALSVGKLLNKAGTNFMGKVMNRLGAAGWEGLTEGLEEPTEVFSKYIGKYLSGQELPADITNDLVESLKDAITVAPIAAVTGLGGSAMGSEKPPVTRTTTGLGTPVTPAAPQAPVRPPVEQSLGRGRFQPIGRPDTAEQAAQVFEREPSRTPAADSALVFEQEPDAITKAAIERQRIIDRTYLPAEEEADRNRLARQTLGLRGPDATDLSSRPGQDIQQAGIPVEEVAPRAGITGIPEKEVLQPVAVPGIGEVRQPVQEPEGQVERRKETSDVITPDHIDALKGLGYDYDQIFLMTPRDADYIIETGRKPGEIDAVRPEKKAKEVIPEAIITEPIPDVTEAKKAPEIAAQEPTPVAKGKGQYEVTVQEQITIGGRKSAEPVEKVLTVTAKSPEAARKAVVGSGQSGKIIDIQKTPEIAEPTPKAKEPWEMTKAEIENEVSKRYDELHGKDLIGGGPTEQRNLKKISPPGTYYHVVEPTYKKGSDIYSFNEASRSGLLTDEISSKKKAEWRNEDFFKKTDSKKVSLFETLPEAISHQNEYGGRILKINVPENLKTNAEGYATSKKIPKEWISQEIGSRRDIVKQALSEGKPVPPEVLKDYPELKAKAPWEMGAKTREQLNERYPLLPKKIVDRLSAIELIKNKVGEMSTDASGAKVLASTEQSLLHEIGHLAEFELTSKQWKQWTEIVKEEAPKGLHGLREGRHINEGSYLVEDLATAFSDYHLGSERISEFPKIKSFIEKNLSKTKPTSKAKEPWEMTFSEQSGIVGQNKSGHKKAIQQALSEGKPVPESVLADYPDLKKAALPSAETVTEPSEKAGPALPVYHQSDSGELKQGNDVYGLGTGYFVSKKKLPEGFYGKKQIKLNLAPGTRLFDFQKWAKENSISLRVSQEQRADIIKDAKDSAVLLGYDGIEILPDDIWIFDKSKIIKTIPEAPKVTEPVKPDIQTVGKAWIDNQQRPIYAIKKAKGKRNVGKIIVTLAMGKTVKIDESKIIEWPEAAEAVKAETQIEFQRRIGISPAIKLSSGEIITGLTHSGIFGKMTEAQKAEKHEQGWTDKNNKWLTDEQARKVIETQAELPGIPKKPVEIKPLKPKLSKVTTLRGMIKQMGRINPVNFKGEVKNWPYEARMLLKNSGLPIDVVEQGLKDEGWLHQDEDLLELLRTDKEALKRGKVAGEMGIGEIGKKTEFQKKEEAEKLKEHEPDAPPGDASDYVQMNVDELPEGLTLTIIEGRSEDGWDEYKVIKTKEGVTLEDGQVLKLEPWEAVEVLKSDLPKAEKKAEPKYINVTPGKIEVKTPATLSLRQEVAGKQRPTPIGEAVSKKKQESLGLVVPDKNQPGLFGQKVEAVSKKEVELYQSKIADKGAEFREGRSVSSKIPVKSLPAGTTEKFSDLIRSSSFLDILNNLIEIPRKSLLPGPTTNIVNRQPPSVKRFLNRVRGNAEFLSDIINSETFLDKGFSGLDRKTQGLVVANMVRLSKNSKVFDSIVKFIPIDVMDNLKGIKITPDMLFHNKTMLQNALSVEGWKGIPTSADMPNALVRSSALAGAIEVSTGIDPDRIGPSQKLTTTIGTFDFDSGVFHVDNGTRLDRKKQGFFSGISPEEVKKIYEERGQKAELTPNGTVLIKIKDGHELEITFADEITPDKLAFEIAYKRPIKKGEAISGKYQNGKITLNRFIADKYSVLHEDYHYLEDIGLVTDRDIYTINRALKNRDATKEDRAAFMEGLLRGRSETKNSKIMAIIQKIQDFIDGLVNLFHRTARGVARDIESGKIFEQSLPNTAFEFAQPLMEVKDASKNILNNPNFIKWFGDSKVVDAGGKPLVVYHGTADKITAFNKSELGRTTGSESAKKGYFFGSNKEVSKGYSEFARPKNIDKLKNEYERLEKIAQKEGTNQAWDSHYKAYAKYENAELAYASGKRKTKENVVEAYLSIKNPMVHDFEGKDFRDETYSDLIDKAIVAGNDGVVFKNTYDGTGEPGTWNNPLMDVYVAFEPTQIKSVFNRGSFDPNDARISYQVQQAKDDLRADTFSLIDKGKALFKKAKPLVGTKKDLDYWGDLIASVPAFFKDKIYAVKKIVESTDERMDEKHETEFYMENHELKGVPGIVNVVEVMKNLSKADQKRFGEYLVKTDQMDFGFGIRNDKDLGWVVKDRSGHANVVVIGKGPGAEFEALDKMLEFEAKDLQKQGFTPEQVNAVMAVRMTENKGFEMLFKPMRDLIKAAEEQGFALPQIPVYRDGKKTTISLKQAMAEMGDMRGSYFPRSRKPGRYVMTAHKEGADSILETHNSRFINKPRVAELEKQGYTVTEARSNKLGEDVFQMTGNLVKTQQIINAALERVEKQAKDKLSSGQIDGINKEIQNIFATALAEQVSNVIRERGARAHMTKRGGDLYLGYEENPLLAIPKYIKGLAGSEAKKNMVGKMMKALTGTEISWADYQTENPEATREDYANHVKEMMIEQGKQPYAFKWAIAYIGENTRNPDFADNVVGMLRGAAVGKYLAFRVFSAPLVNLTALPTSTIATLKGAGLSYSRAWKELGRGIKQYGQYIADGKFGTSKLSENDKWIFDYMTQKGWTDAQYTSESLSALRSNLSRGWDNIIKVGMFTFSESEKLNRGATISAAFNGLSRLSENKGKTKEQIADMAKQVSDDSHGVYNKGNYPYIALGGNPAAHIARMMYVFQRFSHTYLLNMRKLGFEKKDYVALAHMVVAPAVLAGVGASVLTPIISALLKAFGFDDPEEEVYKKVAESFGPSGENLARFGLAGLAGFTIKGSLALGVGAIPTSIKDVLGAPGSVMSDIFIDGIPMIAEGNVAKGFEKIMPTGFGNVIRAYRESTEGLTTKGNRPVFYGSKQVKTEGYETFLRAISLYPSRVAAIREKQYKEYLTESKYTEKRDDIYARIKKFYLSSDRSKEKWLDILAEIEAYNEKARSAGPQTTIITGKSISMNLKRSFKPSRKERMRGRQQ